MDLWEVNMQKSMYRNWFVIGIVLLFVGASIIPASGINDLNGKPAIVTYNGTILYVGGAGPNNYTRIQDAIDNAFNGDTVFVFDDSSPYHESLVVDKSINLFGENTITTVIDGDLSGDVVYLSADGIKFSGFKVQNGLKGIRIQSNHTTITNTNVRSNYGGGLFFWNSEFNVITNNSISYNEGGCGIVISNSNNNTICNNTIIKNNQGIRLVYSSHNNTIHNNNISKNGDYGGSGISIEDSNRTTITGNTISNNWDDGIDLHDCQKTIISHNTFLNDGLSIGNSINNDVENNTVNGKPLVYLVDESDSTIYNAGQVILINCYNISVQSLELSTIAVGIDLRQSQYCLIRNNTITENNRNGIYLLDSQSNVIMGNTFSNNEDVLSCFDSDSNTIIDNVIISNTGYGILLSGSNNTITENTITLNHKYGIYLQYSNNNTITNNAIILNNEGFIIEYCGIQLYLSENNLISDNNISYNKNGISLSSSNSNTITHNTIIENNKSGVSLGESSNNTISCNQMSSHPNSGIKLDSQSSNNTIESNTISYNTLGIGMEHCNDNTIESNIISHNNLGLDINHCDDNIVLKNNFLQNTVHAFILYQYRFHINNLPDFPFDRLTNNLMQNYWGRPRLLRKLIPGITTIIISRGGFGDPKIPIIITFPHPEHDLHPAQEPYIIGV